MKKILIIFSILFIFSNFLPLEAREVDKDKLKDFLNMDLEFINYRGPYDFTNTYDQIIGIGDFLARNLKKANSNSNFYDKYLVNRYIDDESPKSSADVFTIGDRSELDGILNLRRILTGYLMRAFDYDRASAELLAKVITIYNAVYRGDIDYYRNTYIDPSVLSSNKENVGLSRVYSQWAGKTQIFIPLKKDLLLGDIASEVDLDQLITDKVISSILSENEGGVDSARDIVDLQGDIQEIDQSKIDAEADKMKENESEVNETIENLKQQLEAATDETQKQNIQKQLDDASSKKDILDGKSTNIDKAQEKVDSSGAKLDNQREAVQEKIQENIDTTNKDKNLPSPGEINSSNEDKGLQTQEELDQSKPIAGPINSRESNNTLGEGPSSSSVSAPTDSTTANNASPVSQPPKPKDQGVNNNTQKKPKQSQVRPTTPTAANTAAASPENARNSNNVTPQGQNQAAPQPARQETAAANNNNQQASSGTSPAQNRVAEQNPAQTASSSSVEPDLSSNSIDKSVFLEVLDPNTNLAVLHFIDSNTGDQLNEGSQTGVKRYGVYERNKDLIVIKMEGNKAKLQILDKSKNLEIESESKFEVNKDSSFFADSRMILVVVNDNNKFKLAKFSPKDLNSFILSEIEVLPFTSFTVKGNFIFLQDSSKKIITLDINTLKQISE